MPMIELFSFSILLVAVLVVGYLEGDNYILKQRIKQLEDDVDFWRSAYHKAIGFPDKIEQDGVVVKFKKG